MNFKALLKNKYVMYFFIFLAVLSVCLLIRYYFQEDTKETFENLIENGNFAEERMSENSSGDLRGNHVVKMPNPGNSSFVLKQSAHSETDNQTRYQLNINVNPGNSYNLSCWVAYSEKWDGDKNLFTVKFDKDNYLSRDGELVESKQIDDNTWELRQFTFKVPSDNDGKIEIYIGYESKILSGSRYVSDIELSRDFPLVHDIPLKKNLELFLSTYHDESYKTNSWKDLTENDNNFVKNQNINADVEMENATGDKYVFLRNMGFDGPNSNKLIPNEDSFTIFFSGVMDEHSTGSLIVFESNNKYNNGFEIILHNKNGIDNKIEVMVAGVCYFYTVGITQKHGIYTVVYDHGNLEFFKDGYKISLEKTETTQVWDNKNKKLYSPEEKLEMSCSSVKINKDLHPILMKLDSLIMYSASLTSDQIIKVVGYINSYRLKNQHLLPPDTTSVVVNNETGEITTASTCTPTTGKTTGTTTGTAAATTVGTGTTTGTTTGTAGTMRTDLCPFDNIQSSPCTSTNCYGVNWLDINNVSSSCKDDVNTYCKTTGKSDKTCVYLKNVKNQYRKTQQTCKSSNIILNELNTETSSPTTKETSTPLPITEETEESTTTAGATPTAETNIHTDENGNYVNENGEKIDLSLYIRKDKIPCWGCKL